MDDLCDLAPQQLVGRQFTFASMTNARGRLTVFELPIPGEDYAVGSDFAYGLKGRDFDSACVLKTSVTPAIQVAHLRGHFGAFYAGPLYALLCFYNHALLVGEAQVGTFTMQLLWNTYRYRRIYTEKIAGKLGDNETLRLGVHRHAEDGVVGMLQQDLADRRLILLDSEAIAQMGRMKWHNTTEKRTGIREPDQKLKIKLDGGGSPDDVIACAMANIGRREMPRYPKPQEEYAEGTLGHALGFNEDDDDDEGTGRGSWVDPRFSG